MCVGLRLWSCCPAALLTFQLAILLWSALLCAVPRPWVLCCAVMLRIALPCVLLLCAVSCCLALFCAAARCVVPLAGVCRPGVLCLPTLSVVLSPRAVCSVLCVFWRGVCCYSLLCFLLCASPGVVMCVPRPLPPVRCCAACAVLGRLCCAVCLVCDVSRALCCRALLSVVRLPVVLCCVVARCAASFCGPLCCVAASSAAGWLPWCAVQAAVRLCSPLVPCSPVLCPVVLCGLVVLWCPVLLPCLFTGLCWFAFSNFRNHCKTCSKSFLFGL